MTTSKYSTIASAAQYNGVTVASFVEAAWAMVLSRYCSTSDVTFGVTFSGRMGAVQDEDRLVGMTVNTPFRVKVDWKSATLDELLSDVQNTSNSVTAHQRASLVELQNYTDHKRSMFESILVFENYERADDNDASAEREFTLEEDEIREGAEGFLGVSIVPTDNKMRIDFKFNPSDYHEGYIADLAINFDELLTEISEANASHALLKSLVNHNVGAFKAVAAGNEIAASEKLEWLNARPCHTLFVEKALKHPEKIALIDGETGREVIYGELHALSDRMAKKLVALGAKKDMIVGLFAARSIEYFIGMFGVLKAGAAYVPMDPKVPKDRMDFQLEDSDASICLVQNSELMERLGDFEGHCVQIDKFVESNERNDDVDLASIAVDVTDLIYIIYTSGSTGKPKGCQLEHRNVYNIMHTFAYRCDQGWGWGERVLQFFGVAFDGAVIDIYPTLCVAGTTLVLCGADIQETMKTYDVECVNATPSALATLQPEKLPSLKRAFSAGEALPPALVNKFAPYTGGCFNGYGPTECCVCTQLEFVKPGEPVRLGRALPNYRLYVVDKDSGMLCPVGVPGELVVSGIGVSRRGYLNRPEKKTRLPL